MGHSLTTATMFSLSILIPVYNVEQYLPECLDSILVRNGFDGEVICVDDGSTDKSSEILAAYSKHYSNISVIRQENAGASAARNAALRIATGDYVMFVDSDDCLADNAIEILHSMLKSEDVLYFNIQRFWDRTNEELPIVPLPQVSQLNGKTYYERYFNRKEFMPCVCVWGGVYNREFLIRNNLFNKVGGTREDEDFYPRVLYYANSVSAINDVVYYYRLRDGSIMRNYSPKHSTDYISVATGLLDFFEEKKWINPTTLKAVYYLYYTMIYYTVECSLKRPKEFNISQIRRMLACSTTLLDRRTALMSAVSFKLALKYHSYSLPKYQRKLINLLLH